MRFVALDVPAESRPASYGGAVGDVSITSKLSAQQARMGDPVVLTLRVEGTGNVKLWPRPSLSVPWGSLADGAERVLVDTTHARVRGAKEFDWLLTPRAAGAQQVPQVDYPYFDAEQRKYGVASAPPLALDVATASLAVLDSAPTSRLGIRRVLRDETRDPVSSRPWFWLLLAVAPLPAALRRTREGRSARRDTRTAAQRLKAATARRNLSPREVRKLYLDAVSERVPSARASSRSDAFARALRRAGVTIESADEAAKLLDLLDSAAFSTTVALPDRTLDRVIAAVADIDGQAVRELPTRVYPALLIAILCMSAASLAALPTGVDAVFAEGVQAYEHNAFTTAERHFGRVVARAPRAVDAWANLGTAAWAGGDTAAAVRGWQRALRLDPLDSDVRERLDRVQPLIVRTPAYVPPVPVNGLAIGALVLWILGWGIMAVRRERRPVRARAYAGGAMTIAVLLLFGALELHDRLGGRELGVLRHTRMLLEGPGATTAAASAVVGETGVLGAREGSWIYIAVDNGRAGWVPVASVLRIDASPASN